jgi:hypothetical protein
MPQAELKIKAIGVQAPRRREARPISDLSISKRPTVWINVPRPAHLPLTAIEQQPILTIVGSSLTQNAAMVLEGEKQRFTVTLRNSSTTTAVDVILFSFHDSTQGQVQAALTNRDTTPAELYEYELILARKPALRHIPDEDSELKLAPGGTLKVEFEMLGKPGLTSASIVVDYAYIGKPITEVEGQFYTRQVSLPITVTVNASVELSRVDMLPLSGPVPCDLFHNSLEHLGGKDATNSLDGKDYSLLSLDFRNAWPAPLHLRLEFGYSDPHTLHILEDFDTSVAVSTKLDYDIIPGSTQRVLLVIPRLWISDPHRQIPNLDGAKPRQFVVSAGNVSAEAERTSREAWWFREYLLKCFRASWWSGTEGSGRSGIVELRGIRLLPRMVEALRLPSVEISLDVANRSKDGDAVEVEAHEFFEVKVKLRNRTEKPIWPFLRVQPALRHHPHGALELNKKLAWDGTLQCTLPLLPSGEELETNVTFITFCRGEFEIGASVEETVAWKDDTKQEEPYEGQRQPAGRQRANTGALMDSLLKKKDRRMWHARAPLVVRAVDAM